MDIDVVKNIDLQHLIENETGLRFKRDTLQHCPFCNSGNHGTRNSDSAFKIKASGINTFFNCFSCGKAGSTIDFIIHLYGKNISESIEYLKQRYLSSTELSKGNIYKVNGYKNKTVTPDYIPMEWVNKSMSGKTRNNLTAWMESRFAPEEATDALLQYKVGTSKHWNGATVFYNIDEAQMVRRGKIMLYNPYTGKRNRQKSPTSVHTVMNLKEKPESCLFGMHLRDTYPDKIIAVVESEKTAIIMSIVYPDYLWMATGGLTFLKPVLFKPLKGRKILLFPDLGDSNGLGTPYEQWGRKLSEIRKYVMEAAISDLLERKCTDEQRKDGYDIADFFIEKKQAA